MTIRLPVNEIVQGNVLEVLRTFPSESIDAVVSSPPYWNLRAYGTHPQIWGGELHCQHAWKDQLTMFREPAAICALCGAWRGELGQEPFFFSFVQHLCDVFDEIRRVLKPTGTCWVNLGDTYAARDRTRETQPKSLCQIPSRFAIEMANRGWILRNELIWWKPNITPASIKDRFTVDFEKIFLFSKSQSYYFEQQFEPSTNPTRLLRRSHNPDNQQKVKYGDKLISAMNPKTADASRLRVLANGRNKRAVWRVATGRFNGAHFAVYPPALLETPIKAGCPEFICKACETPRRKILHTFYYNDTTKDGRPTGNDRKGRGRAGCFSLAERTRKYVAEQGYTDCGCNAGFRPGIVLDPFMGSGTTALVALRLGRSFVGIELNADYIRMAHERIAMSIR